MRKTKTPRPNINLITGVPSVTVLARTSARPSSCAAYVISSVGFCTGNKRLKIARPLRVAARTEGEESRIARRKASADNVARNFWRARIARAENRSYGVRFVLFSCCRFCRDLLRLHVLSLTTSWPWRCNTSYTIYTFLYTRHDRRQFLHQLLEWRRWYFWIDPQSDFFLNLDGWKEFSANIRISRIIAKSIRLIFGCVNVFGWYLD